MYTLFCGSVSTMTFHSTMPAPVPTTYVQLTAAFTTALPSTKREPLWASDLCTEVLEQARSSATVGTEDRHASHSAAASCTAEVLVRKQHSRVLPRATRTFFTSGAIWTSAARQQ